MKGTQIIGIITAALCAGCGFSNPQPQPIAVDQIWAGCAAGYSMITVPPYQFVAYYDTARYMTVAQRKLDERAWKRQRLPTQVGWDAHNSIEMALDSAGFIHVSGNMHVDTLVYFRSDKPFDVATLKRYRHMVGKDEDAVTYPEFFKTPEGSLIFGYRLGSSGKGNQIYNRYNVKTRSWHRLLDVPLIDGQGQSNAYVRGPVSGPDGYFHLIWVWRMNPDANANSNISYARSKDLVTWEQSDGTPQQLPITMQNCEIVDPIPPGNGLLNGNIALGFDQNNNAVVSYHKYDEDGNIQIYNARKEAGEWVVHQTTDWDWRWDFGGWGSITARLGLQGVVVENGNLTQTVFVDTAGYQKFVLDGEQLHVKREEAHAQHYPDSLRELTGNLELAQVNLVENTAPDYGTYLLRWETLKRNRDQPYGFIPEPQWLELYHYDH